MSYLHDTIAYGLRNSSNGGVLFLLYNDSDLGARIVDGKITYRYCFILGFAMISWPSRKQHSISQSNAKDEYIGLSTTCREALFLRNLLIGLFDVNLALTMIRCDN